MPGSHDNRGRNGTGENRGGRQGSGSRHGGRAQGGGSPAGERNSIRRGQDGQKLWTKNGQPARGDRSAQAPQPELTPEQQMRRELRSVRPHHDDPDLPGDVNPRDLDKEARLELKTLTKENAEWVAQHLIMAARLIDEDPVQAHKHALSAARRAGRIAVVRETLAITAYATGDFALALRELRTYRRLSGSNNQIPLMVDSERGVGRPDRALELGRSVDRDTLPPAVQVSLALAMSGARLDLGQPESALAELEIAQLDPKRAFSWSPDLFHAYAEVLEDLGRAEEASAWRARAVIAQEALVQLIDDGEETVIVVEEHAEDSARRVSEPGMEH